MSYSEALRLCQKANLTIDELVELKNILQRDVKDLPNARITGEKMHQLINATISSRNLPALQLVYEFTQGKYFPTIAGKTSLSFAIQERWLDAVLVLLDDEKSIIGATTLHLNALAHDSRRNITLDDLLIKDRAGHGVLEYAACAKNLVLIKSIVLLVLAATTMPEGVRDAFISAFPYLAEGSTYLCTDAAICSILSPLRLKLSFRACEKHVAVESPMSYQHSACKSRSFVTDSKDSKSALQNSSKRKNSYMSVVPDKIASFSNGVPQKQQTSTTADIVDHLLRSNDYADHVSDLLSIFHQGEHGGSVHGTCFSVKVLYNYLKELPKHAPLLRCYTSLLRCTYPNICLHYIDFELYVSTNKCKIPSEIGLVKTYKGKPIYALQGLFSADVSFAPKGTLNVVATITGIEYDINIKKRPWLSTLSYTEWTNINVRKCINWFLSSSPQALDHECSTQSLLTPVTNKYVLSKLPSLISSFKDNQVKLQSHQIGCTLYKHRSGLYLYRFHVDVDSPLPCFPHIQYTTNAHPKPLANSSGKIVVFGKGIDTEVKTLKALDINHVVVHEVQQFFSPFVPIQKLATITKVSPLFTEPYCVDHEIIEDHTTLRPRKDGHFHCALYDALQLSFCTYRWLYQIVTPDLIKPKDMLGCKGTDEMVVSRTPGKDPGENVED
ncbi:Hypothetical protein GLP15_2406 [Giardia lamblia P15]|uniref:Uncharacterized protein n=1 Tax=Giardia intestinalis (strain P15) TaxID=658858 RepID=E1EYZ7_GIAIA|nr:Hypothetical protein GLP15_2406 [Giardia lamblia P15]